MIKVKALLYCTKEKNKYDRLVSDEHYGKTFYLYGAITENFESLNGKIVCECEVETEEIELLSCLVDSVMSNKNGEINIDDFLKHSCLNFSQLEKYLKYVAKDKDISTQVGYALHISNVKERVMELTKVRMNKKGYLFGEFITYTPIITKAPQNMQWCYIYENGKWVKYLLISVRPQWVCKILNHEKDIEVRRKVLKGMVD